ncbi:5'-nucleotidase C-terminal domain-containing protein [Chromatiaceae bacterium AAb-1]|nr:5'-nucleotidase C-terminal domain-containing protein [Chromatiaceae bacterium AAb-1]
MYRLVITCMIFALLTSCTSKPADERHFELAVFHINDHHSNLAAKHNVTLTLAGVDTQLDIGGFPRVVTQLNTLSSRYANSLKLHAGDAITGDLYYSLFKGHADADFMNLVCFDAFTLGNHEFDDSDANLKQLLDALAAGNCETEVLSANVIPEIGTPLAPDHQWQSFKPYTIKEFNDVKVGIIGLTIAQKTRQSSQPLPTTVFLDETETARRYIKELKAKGIGKIILLTHYGYDNDIRLAQALPDVDLIVGGDSHSLLGNFQDVGLTPEGEYPTKLKNASGELVCVVQGKDYSQVVGEVVLQFKGDQLTECGGRPHMLLADNFSRNGAAVTPAEHQQITDFISQSDTLTLVEQDAVASEMLQRYSKKVMELSSQQISELPERLCRIAPGKLRESSCGNNMQSDLHYLVSKAFLAQSRQADIALQNAGGVRSDLPAGPLSIAQVYQLLPFSNTLINFRMSGAEVKQVLEDAISYSLAPGGSDGAYPQGAGIQFDVDLTAAENNRVSNIQIQNRETQQWQAAQPEQEYIVVTNSFIASGLDGWATFGRLQAEGRTEDTYINYAQAFIDFVKSQPQLLRPEAGSHSTRSIIHF